MTVISDSVTAGLGNDDRRKTWPQLLAEDHGLGIQDISHIGETAASALKRVQQHSIQSDLIIIEIGGNDVLGGTTAAECADNLEALICALNDADHEQPNNNRDRQLLMFELPLPPFYTKFGKHQRDIAARHHVKLTPKLYFYSVIGRQHNTVDGVHLSQEGHRQMVDVVWQIIRDAANP